MEVELSPGVLLSLWCGAIFDSWVRRGLEQVVLCPGSRNAPLIEEALRRPALSCHSVIDERSAAFLALGLARISERPTVVCCTSGSALGHFMPAVMEAHHADVPLIVLTADRPASLQGRGAPQTLEQPGALAPFAPSDCPWLEPSGEAEVFQRWLRALDRVWTSACEGSQPVHFNVPLAKPLEPHRPLTTAEFAFRDQVRVWLEEASHRPRKAWAWPAHPPRLDLISIGPCSASAQRAAQRLADGQACPLLSEFPQGRAASLPGPVARWLDAQPGKVRWLHVGHPHVQSKWGLLQKRPDVELWVASGRLPREPLGAGQVIFGAPLTDQVESLLQVMVGAESFAAPNASASWTPPQESREQVKRALSELPLRDAAGWPEPHALSALLSLASVGVQQLVLGNSLLLRTAGRLSPLLEPGPQYHLSRGVNGIDGGIAHACGAAIAAGGPTLSLLGDVAALHDAGSLALAQCVQVPLVIAVVDNGGGRIFDSLPVAKDWDQRPGLKEYLRTPTAFDWRSWTQAYGVTYESAQSEESLQASWGRCLARNGVTVLHLQVSSQLTREFFGLIAQGEPSGWGDGL